MLCSSSDTWEGGAMTTLDAGTIGQPTLPGRLGRPESDLRSDPRSDPRMVASMAPFGMDVQGPPAPVQASSPLPDKLAFIGAAEAGFEAVFASLAAGLPEVAGLTNVTEVIKGVDGNDITLYVTRPANQQGPLPGILHLHGGGMTLLTARGPLYARWRNELAATGLVVVGVEFRNGGGSEGPYPFPAGLNDCFSALEWMQANAQRLRISKIVVSGESGGGNLTLATSLKAKATGKLDLIGGVYAMCPFISGGYDWTDEQKLRELPSLIENDGYFIGCALSAVVATIYDPDGSNTANPLCWPYHASEAELRGMPPHVISTNELDPLRDEGLAYYRKLAAAGVSVAGRTVTGTCHAGDMMFRASMPEVYASTIADIHAFATRL